jgi:hypothetical protein
MPMNSSLTSSLSELSKGRVVGEPSNGPPRRRWNPITTARSWLGKPVSFATARVVMIFLVGFAGGIAWQSYGGEVRKAIAGWSPHLAWLTPAAAPNGTSADRFKAISLALATARQSLDKLGTEISRAQAQDDEAPKRKR